MADKAELRKIISDTREDVEEWMQRNKRVTVDAPYPSNSPCYYCDVFEYKDETGIRKCDYCIHNHSNKLLELLEVDK